MQTIEVKNVKNWSKKSKTAIEYLNSNFTNYVNGFKNLLKELEKLNTEKSKAILNTVQNFDKRIAIKETKIEYDKTLLSDLHNILNMVEKGSLVSDFTKHLLTAFSNYGVGTNVKGNKKLI